ncbi:signal peptidase I [uncultured Friedmanniella sp.]|uniref:signal peptidase I n=1 Tax=uncultured Friedmanniella sp. TaxID=335381 RepID=UPI0035C98B61
MTDETVADPDVAVEPRSLSFGGHVLAFLGELSGVVVGAIIVASLLRALVGQMFLIPSSSMEQTLQIKDRVVVEKLTRVQRGEVVVFRDPGGWLNGPPAPERGRVGRALEFVGVLPDTGTDHLIKRVVGLPGDHVVCCDSAGRITVNDVALDETSYLDTPPGGEQAEPSMIPFDVVVPRDRIFVLGDNRDYSRDSRCHLHDQTPGAVAGSNAFVSEDLVVGQAVAVLWPVGHARRLRIPATFDPVPAAAAAPAVPTIDAGPEASC